MQLEATELIVRGAVKLRIPLVELTRFEAKAGRLPVLLTLPMIVFILPCVFLIVAGPAMYDVLRMMRG